MWGQRPSEVVQLDEDPYTEYCFDEAVAFSLILHESPSPEELDEMRSKFDSQSLSGNDAFKVQKQDGTVQQFNNALDFMTQDKYQAGNSNK